MPTDKYIIKIAAPFIKIVINALSYCSLHTMFSDKIHPFSVSEN